MKIRKLPSRTVILSLHVTFWAILLLFPLFFSAPGKPFATVGYLPVPFYLISVGISAFLFYSNAFFLYPLFCNRKKWWVYLLAIIVLFFGIQRLKIIILTIGFPGVQIYGVNAPFIFAPTFFALAGGTIYRYLANLIQEEKISQAKEAEQLSMELKFLRSQINPHFLFNVLANLVSLARKRSDLLEPSLIKLSDIMRYMLYDTNVKKVTLDKEIEYLKNYISLQQLRFEGDVTIDTSFDLEPDASQYKIEPMLLISFVENAFKHGIGWIKDPFIFIQISVAKGYLTFVAENKFSLEDQQHKDSDSGIGLSNVKSRLKLLYPNRHKLTITSKDNTFHVHLILKL